MLRIKIIAIGKVREKFYKDACDEYRKRLSRYAKLDIIELADERSPDCFSEADILQVKEKEGMRILSKISPADYVVALAIDGKRFDSVGWSNFFSECMISGKSSIAFIIGGSNGLSDKVMSAANESHSFSSFTFCHQLMRVILLEQIFRSMKILAGETYHK